MSWYRVGFLNLVEHFVSRVGDTAATLIVIALLSPDEFGSVAISAAWVAPFLLLFISPENILFRDLKSLEKLGHKEMQATLSTFRIFGWMKGLSAILLAMGVSCLIPSRDANTLPSCLWAFSFLTAVHVCGADREFLRVTRQIGRLNRLNMIQKLILLLLLGVVATTKENRLWALAGIGVTWMILSGSLFAITAGSHSWVFSPARLIQSVRDFSFWHHIGGIIQQWILSVDLFLLSFSSAPKSILGLYGIGLRITNLLLALPLTVQSTVMIWIGNQEHRNSLTNERRRVLKICAALGAGLAALSALIYLTYPWILRVLLRQSQLSDTDVALFGNWLVFFLSGGVLASCGYPWIAYLHLRTRPKFVVARILIPWGVLSLISYYSFIYLRGIQGAAEGNLVSGILFWIIAVTTPTKDSASRPSDKEKSIKTYA